MLEMVLGFIVKAVCGLFTMGLILLGMAIASYIFDWENFKKIPE